MAAVSTESREGEASELRRVAEQAGITGVRIVAWRDLEDLESGGSERHAAAIAHVWAGAGLEVTLRTSAAPGLRSCTTRDGYKVVRRNGRRTVFAAVLGEGLLGRLAPRPGEAVLEVWNGMPFFSPIWAPHPRAVVIHHVHADLWRLELGRLSARLGRAVETRVAPPFYERVPICAPSRSSAAEITDLLGLPASNVSVVPPGVDPRFTPGGRRSPDPLVLAVGRLVPVKRFDMLVDLLVELRDRHPRLEAVIVGEGRERPALESRIAARGAGGWCRLAGRVSDEELLGLYRRSWILASCSAREGWGMTISEAAACATPAVASLIPGHTDSVENGVTGLLADGPAAMLEAMDRLVSDEALRRRMGLAALAATRRLSWEAAALSVLQAIASDLPAKQVAAVASRTG